MYTEASKSMYVCMHACIIIINNITITYYHRHCKFQCPESSTTINTMVTQVLGLRQVNTVCPLQKLHPCN